MNNQVIALFYRPRYEDDRQLLCICSSEAVANNRIDYLMAEYPHAYDERSRFELDVEMYFSEENGYGM